MNFFAPGSGARYAVPTIGEVTCVPLFSITDGFLPVCVDMMSGLFLDRETFTFVVPSAYSISLSLNSFK